MDNQPTLEESPRPLLIIIVIIIIIIIKQLGKCISHTRLSNRRLEQVSPDHCDWWGEGVSPALKDQRYQLCSLRRYISLLRSYALGWLFTLRACFLKNSRGWTYQPASEMNERTQQAGLGGASEQCRENTNKYGTYVKKQKHGAQRPTDPRRLQAGSKMKARPLARVKS